MTFSSQLSIVAAIENLFGLIIPLVLCPLYRATASHSGIFGRGAVFLTLALLQLVGFVASASLKWRHSPEKEYLDEKDAPLLVPIIGE